MLSREATTASATGWQRSSVVEQGNHNPLVGGSNPSAATINKKPAFMAGFLLIAVERDLNGVHDAEACMAESVTARVTMAVTRIRHARNNSRSAPR